MIPTVQMYMARVLETMEAGELISKAELKMSKHGIHHLPVLKNGSVVGILSDRDIKLAGSILGPVSANLPIIDVCTPNPYVVEPETPLSEVVAAMANNHYGCALVLESQKLVGIFTTVDACRVLSDLIRVKF